MPYRRLMKWDGFEKDAEVPEQDSNLTEIVFLTYLENSWRAKGCQRTGKLFNKQIMNF